MPNYKIFVLKSQLLDKPKEKARCLSEHVGLSIQASTARAANSTINATNAVASIPDRAVPAHLPAHEVNYLSRVLSSPPATPIKVAVLQHYLTNYETSVKRYLLEGFSQGFKIHYNGDRKSRFSGNLTSAKEQPGVMSENLAKELTIFTTSLSSFYIVALGNCP